MKQIFFLLVFIAGSKLFSQGPSLCFSPALNSPFSSGANTYAKSLINGDFNADGKMDMAIANQNGNSISIFLGTGSGNFGAPTNFTVNGFPYCVTACDMNNDGKLDLATANFASNSDVSVLFGNGSGSFGAATNYTTGLNPQWVTYGDFNADGNKDLVATANTSVTVFLGSPTGTLAAPMSFSVGMTPQCVAVADFNSDGNADIASSNRMSFDVAILLGTGTGSFSANTNYTVGAMFPCSIVADDFNGDGKADIATSNFDGNNTKNVTVMLNSGTGTFLAPTVYGMLTNGAASSIDSGDMNGDGKKDIVIVNNSEIGFLLGNGLGTFGSATAYTTTSNFTRVIIQDYNTDGRPDLAISGGNGDNAELWLNRTAVVIASGPTTFCSGGKVTLRATKGGNSYLWAPGGSIADSLVVTSSGTYSVSINSGLCSSNSTLINVVVNPLPAINIAVNGSVICAGSTSTLTSSGASTYSWSTGANASAISVNPTITTSYSVTGTDLNGCMNSSSKTVTVNPLPSLSLSSASVSCNALCNGSITATAGAGTGPYTYSPSLTNLCAGNYTVLVSDSKGCSTSKTVSVSQPLPLAISIASSASVICSGSSSTLSASGTGGTGVISYTWLNTGATLMSIAVSPSTSTTYTLTGKDANGCTSMMTKSITVNALPSLTISSVNEICQFSAAGLSGSGASTYTWSTGPVTGSIIVSPTVTTTYTLSGTGSNGCMNSIVKTLTVNPLPTVATASSHSLLCTTQSATLSATGTAIVYNWNPGGAGTSIVVSPTVNTTYTVTGTDAKGCAKTAVITQSVSTCAGIYEKGKEEIALTVYPNPNNGVFMIKGDKESSFLIFNELGQFVQAVELSYSNDFTCQVKGLGTGMYFVYELSSGVRQKIVVTE
jgi:hypothetical protein